MANKMAKSDCQLCAPLQHNVGVLLLLVQRAIDFNSWHCLARFRSQVRPAQLQHLSSQGTFYVFHFTKEVGTEIAPWQTDSNGELVGDIAF